MGQKKIEKKVVVEVVVEEVVVYFYKLICAFS
jgi:hypothetical protein